MQEDVYEDIGYRRFDKFRMDETRKIITQNRHENSLKIQFLTGFLKGKEAWRRIDIAEELIRRGVAREVKG